MDPQFLADMALYTALFFAAVTLGAMAFFGLGVAPVVHKVLDKDRAGTVTRALFPVYYLVLAIASVLAAVPAFLINVTAGIVLAVIAGGFVFARQVMMPRINALGEEVRRGSTVAKGAYDMMHAWSIRMNMLQLFVLLVVFWFLALSAG